MVENGLSVIKFYSNVFDIMYIVALFVLRS